MFNVLVVVGFVFICKILLRYLLMPMLGHRHDDAAKDYELRLNMEDYLCMSSKPIRSEHFFNFFLVVVAYLQAVRFAYCSSLPLQAIPFKCSLMPHILIFIFIFKLNYRFQPKKKTMQNKREKPRKQSDSDKASSFMCVCVCVCM